MYDKRDLKLIKEELTRLYGKDVAKNIMVSQSDNLFEGKQSVAYALGKRSIKFFALFYLRDMFIGDGKAPLSQEHYDVWDSLSNMFNNNESYNKRNHLYPRGFGKTSIINVPTVIWANLYGFSVYTVIGSSIKDTATSFMMSIREGLIDNPRIDNTFGVMVDNNLINNTEKLQLTNDTMIQITSARTTLRGVNYKGNRINLLVLDDYMSEENTSSTEAMDKHWNMFVKNALPAVEKHKHWILGFGTTQKKGDFYNRLENDPTFITRRKPAIPNIQVFETPHWQKFKELLFSGDNGLQKAQEYYYEHEEEMEYERIWDYFNCVDLAILYFSDTSSFLQEYQLEFADGESVKFTNVVYDEVGEGNVLVIDPATSNKSTSDYTAFVVGAMIDDIIEVEYAEIDRLDFDEYVSRTINILKEYPSIDTIVIEKQTYNSADVIAMKTVIERDMELYYRDFKWINEHQSKNKDSKIDSIVGDVNMGRVKFNIDLKDTPPIKQLQEFTSTKSSRHDDFPDALSELVIYLKENNLNQGRVHVYDMGMLF